jgi:DNA-binding MarR family transcriptional regulator/N-acetylglutamate synthase-like GNAT family acetyltransferase
MDFIQELGYLAIASRLKRLTDRLLRGGSDVYKALRLEFEPRWFSLFYLLHVENAPVSILEAAAFLRVSHPAVIQTAKMLTRRGLVKSAQDSVDRRKRLLVITPKGKRLAESLQPVWDCFISAATELFQEAGTDMLEAVQRVENKLDEEDIGRRILRMVKARQYEAVEIADFRPEHRDMFRKLNEEWLKKHFRVEPADREMLLHPEREILQKGGFIFFARLGGAVVGAAALLKLNDSAFELAKMAVTEAAQGKQAGRKLLDAAIARARQKGARTVYLKTDKCLRAALGLYRSAGFQAGRPPSDERKPLAREKTATYLKLDLGRA